MQKRTLYDLLGVSRDASHAAVRAAYDKAIAALELEAPNLSGEAVNIRRVALKEALNVLSNDLLRGRYDARLRQKAAPPAATSAPVVPAQTELSLQPIDVPPPAAPFVTPAAPAAKLENRAAVPPLIMAHTPDKNTTLRRLTTASHWMSTGLRLALSVLGTIFLIWLIWQTMFFKMATSGAERGGRSESAHEKVIIQDYYQETGVRAKSAAEVELLRAEDQRKAEARQQAQKQEWDKQRQEVEYRRFVEESRREGARVSENLRRAEEEQRRQAEAEKERRLMEERVQAEREQERIERERTRWRQY